MRCSASGRGRDEGEDRHLTLAVDQVLNHGADVEATVARLLAYPYHYDRVTAK